MAIAGDVAALGTRYSPRKPYINSVPDPDIPPTPWQATQVWLLTRHGLVGLVELEAAEEQTVPYIGGEIRLGPAQQARPTEETGVFRCGDLEVRLLEHDFATTNVRPARPGYAQKSTGHTAVILRTAGDIFTARPGDPLRYAAVIAPHDAPRLKAFTRLEAAGVWGFFAELAGEPLAVLFNPGEGAGTARVPWPQPTASLHLANREPFVTRTDNATLSVEVPPRSVALITSGHDR